MRAYERLIQYASYPTASDENSPTCPSTPAQTDFAKILVKELQDLGIANASVDENGYVFARIPATAGRENAPKVGFIAHMDVVREVPYENVKPRVVEKYAGGAITLNEEKQIVMTPEEYPALNRCIGCDLVVTDGTTLLGADDKAGIAAIMTMAERIMADPSMIHGDILIGFTPDEEIGRGADLFDVPRFGADFAYTVDGSMFGEVEYETFNAASLTVKIKGRSIHPGAAKDKMINASLVACEYIALLPPMARPEKTEGYEGFFHVTSMSGSVEYAEIHCIIRDHDLSLLEKKSAYAAAAAEELCKKYGEGTVIAEIKESYRNMKEMILPNFHIVETAYAAVRDCGGEPFSVPVRGGTDGSRLSFMGLPCPNLGTGSYNHHGRFEFACVQEMDKITDLLIRIAEKNAE